MLTCRLREPTHVIKKKKKWLKSIDSFLISVGAGKNLNSKIRGKHIDISLWSRIVEMNEIVADPQTKGLTSDFTKKKGLTLDGFKVHVARMRFFEYLGVCYRVNCIDGRIWGHLDEHILCFFFFFSRPNILKVEK